MPGYDYTLPGAYFVTICVRDGECLLGAVVDEAMQLGAFGQIAHEFWAQVVVHFPGTALDVFTTMPNHVHAVIVIQEPSLAVGPEEESEETSPLQDGWDGVREGERVGTAVQRATEGPSLGKIVAYYKYQTTVQVNQLRDMPGVPFWQRNYWEHIIRDETSFNRIREYIEDNPARWAEDQLHPEASPNRFNRWQSHRRPFAVQTR